MRSRPPPRFPTKLSSGCHGSRKKVSHAFAPLVSGADRSSPSQSSVSVAPLAGHGGHLDVLLNIQLPPAVPQFRRRAAFCPVVVIFFVLLIVFLLLLFLSPPPVRRPLSPPPRPRTSTTTDPYEQKRRFPFLSGQVLSSASFFCRRPLFLVV